MKTAVIALAMMIANENVGAEPKALQAVRTIRVSTGSRAFFDVSLPGRPGIAAKITDAATFTDEDVTMRVIETDGAWHLTVENLAAIPKSIRWHESSCVNSEAVAHAISPIPPIAVLPGGAKTTVPLRLQGPGWESFRIHLATVAEGEPVFYELFIGSGTPPEFVRKR